MQGGRYALRSGLGLAALLAAAPAGAATVDISTSAFGATFELGPNERLGQNHTFADLDGQAVYFQFSDGFSGFTRFSETGPDGAEAVFEPDEIPPILDVNSGFRLSGAGDTGSNPWTLENISDPDGGILESITVSFAGAELTPWFDRSEPDPGTPDSGFGQDFTLTGSSPDGVIAVTYRTAHPGTAGDLSGLFFFDVPETDAYKELRIDLTGLDGGGLAIGDSISFYQDTDVALVPLPGGILLLASGVVGALLLGARRRP